MQTGVPRRRYRRVMHERTGDRVEGTLRQADPADPQLVRGLVAARTAVGFTVRPGRHLGRGRPGRVGGAGLAWFIPGWAVIEPKLIFNHLWRSTEADQRIRAVSTARPDPTGPPTGRVPRFHTAWWCLWLLGGALGLVAVALMVRVTTLGGLLVMELGIAAAGATLMAAGLLFQKVLTRTTRRQAGGRRDARAPVPVPGRARLTGSSPLV